jgi:hypothetical protein
LPEVKSPVSADKLCNLVKSLHDRNVRVYARIELERFEGDSLLKHVAMNRKDMQGTSAILAG